jgi:Ca-activated chloride channel homolog
VLGAYVLAQRRRSRYAMRFTNLDLLANVVDRAPRWRRHVPPAVFLLALAALIVGVARPQAVVKSPQEQATVVLAMDVSNSMDATDVEPTRLVAAKRAARTFVERAPEELRIGLVAFGSEARVVAAPTADREQVAAAIDLLQPQGGTAIGDAIATTTQLRTQAEEQLASQRNAPPLVVLLLSDGAPSPDTLDPLEAAQSARADGVRVFTVALGTQDGTVTLTDEFGNEQVVPVPPDRETLSQIASVTGGEFFEAPDDDELERVYTDLGSQIGFEEEERDITFAFAAGGAMLLLVSGVLSLAWFNRLP